MSLTALCVGCGSEAPKLSAVMSPAEIKTVAAPQVLAPGKLALILDASNLAADGRAKLLYIGDSEAEVDSIYKPKAADFVSKVLPPAFGPEYRAKIVENSTEGFGAIYYRDQLALAMFHDENLPDADVMRIQQVYQDYYGLPSQFILGAKVRYWFWIDSTEQKSQRLMLSAVQDPRQSGRFDVTTAVGDMTIMSALRMGPKEALEDKQAVEKQNPVPNTKS